MQFQTEKAHETQPVPDLKLGLLAGQPVQALQNQNLEHQNGIHRRATTPRAIRPPQRSVQIGVEHLEIHNGGEPFQLITGLGQRRISLIEVKQTWRMSHAKSQIQTPASESGQPGKRDVFRSAPVYQ